MRARKTTTAPKKTGDGASDKHERRKRRLDPLRRPDEIEQRLFDVAKAVHVEKHFGTFERCWEKDCKETLRILNINGFLHRFDDPALTKGTNETRTQTSNDSTQSSQG